MRLCQITLLLGLAVPAAASANDPSSITEPSSTSSHSNPAPSTDAAIAPGSVLLVWTTPGDDGNVGVATRFDLRYSRNPITSSNFNNATRVNFVISPGAPGSMTQMLVNGLDPAGGYYFAIKTADERPNWSAISNIAYWDGSTTSVETSIPHVELSQVWPNPARGSTQFSLKMSHEEDVRIEVFDVSGRRVRILEDGKLQGGSQSYVWNFRDDVGRRLERGVYLMRAKIGPTTFTRRIVAAE